MLLRRLLLLSTLIVGGLTMWGYGQEGYGQELELVKQRNFDDAIEHYSLSPVGYVGYFFTHTDEASGTNNRHFIVQDILSELDSTIPEDPIYFEADGLRSNHISMATLDSSSRLLFVSDPNKYSLYDLAVVSKGAKNWSDDSIATPISSLALSESVMVIAHGMPEATITVRDLETKHVIAELTGHTDFVSKVVIGTDDNTLASMSDDGTVKVWDSQQGTSHASFEVLAEDIAISSDNSTLIIKDSDTMEAAGELIFVDLNTLEITNRIAGIYGDSIFAGAGTDFTGAGSLLVAGHEGISLLDVASGDIVKQAYPYASSSEIDYIYDVTVSQDNQLLVVAKRNSLEVWRWADGSPLLP